MSIDQIANKVGYRTAKDLVDLGKEFLDLERIKITKLMKSLGNSHLAMQQTSKGDYDFAAILCQKGLDESILINLGKWVVGGNYFFYPKSRKWSVRGNNEHFIVSSFDEFLETVLGDTTFCKVDKK